MEKEKVKYRPCNWNKYNRTLIDRGSLTLWISDDVINQWYNWFKNIGRGISQTYSDVAIICAAQIKFLYKLPIRAVQGFLKSLFKLLDIDLKVPNYSTISRRMRFLNIRLNATKSKKYKHIAIDSSGLKLYGEGEWKVRTHGWSKRRTWKKMHLGIDVDTQEIVCCDLTGNKMNDSELFDKCLKQLDKAEINQVSADGAYDTENCYQYCKQNQIKLIVPPRENAVLKYNANSPKTSCFKARDNNIKHIEFLGEKVWKSWSGYTRRSLAETAMFRFKKTFSGKLSSRNFFNQRQEFMIKCNILNIFARMGMPKAKPDYVKSISQS